MFRWDPNADPFADAARLGALRMARSVELRQRREEMAAADGEPETAGLALLGRYLRRSRLLAQLSQQQLADKAGVSQSMVSRVERGVAPAAGVVRLVRMVQPLARLFPFGVCPHDHSCSWQPIREVHEELTRPSEFIKYMLSVAGER
jgi:transcriptional regulator with XRE-family HTH domain